MRTWIVIGATLALTACGTLPPTAEQARDVPYTCDRGPNLTATFSGSEAALRFGRSRAVLQATEVASGARYANPDEQIVFWTKGEAAMLEFHGIYWTCQVHQPNAGTATPAPPAPRHWSASARAPE
ncbi:MULTISPECIES: MliC family protein [unclassified Thioalkalivibrio]|uniref:MliC family protein n=1 Tax=unclassified Thioalkalivibrio TaxID=2621013 RepID=UPI0004771058|nr:MULTISPECIES: MliC family protein [unclassified Thioalkalivibrio]